MRFRLPRVLPVRPMWRHAWRWFTAGVAWMTLAVAASAATPAELVNISVRTRVGTGEAVLIAGFVVSGAGTRPLLVRAVGPTIGAAPYHVPGVLTDPGVRIHEGNTVLFSNDDWQGDAGLAAAFARIGAFPLQPDAGDAALLAPLTEGIYTAVAHGQDGGIGEMLLEVYDARDGTGPVPAISNLSLRAELPPGGTMIAGFIISGGSPKRLLIRAIGPTLAGFGVEGVLEDPALRLFTGSTDVAINDDWNDAANAEAISDAMRTVGAFALARNARDAAALTSLQPGAYTLHVTSSDPEGGGITLVEIYDADPLLATAAPPASSDPELPTVAASTTDAAAHEAGDPAEFLLTRTGDTSSPLTVQVHWSGTAMPGLDYAALPTQFTIPAGSATLPIQLSPLPDALVEAPEAAIVTLVPGPDYNLGVTQQAGALIADQPASSNPGWQAEYFNNRTLQGTPVLVRTDASIAFDWLEGSPDPAVRVDNFSARWTGVITPAATQDYTFIVHADDQVRLTIDGEVVIDRPYYDWVETSATLLLAGGVPHTVVLEFVDNWGDAHIFLDWSTTGQGRRPLTEVIAPVPTPAAAIGLDRTIAIVGEAYVGFITASGTPTAYSAAGLPPGLAVHPVSGTISGTPSQPGEYTIWLGATNAAGGGSVPVTLRVLAPEGFVVREVFAGSASPLGIAPGSSPASTQTVTTLECTSSGGPLTQRLRGYLTAPMDGLYRFWLSANGPAEFRFADSDEPGDIVLRAHVSEATGVREWNREPGQMSPLLELKAGERYAFEIVHAHTSATGHLELGWLQPGQTGLRPFAIVPGFVLSPYTTERPLDDGRWLFVASLRTPAGSTAISWGSALLYLTADETSATATVSLSALSSAAEPTQVVHAVHGVVGTLPAGACEDAPWDLAPAAGLSSAQLVAALRAGELYLRVPTTAHPTGELIGTLRPSVAAAEFVPPAEPPEVASPAPTAADAARFLTQATFGPNAEEIARVQSIGYEAWLEEQFAAPHSRLLPYIQRIRAERRAVDPNAGVWTDVMTESWWRNVIAGPDQLRQRVNFALSEIFVVSENSALGGELDGLATYYDLLGANAFGNVRDLLEHVTLNPAMGVYLSMIRNRKPDPALGIYPDENYAREVMQLFSIGLHKLHPDGTPVRDSRGQLIPTYTQDTIVGLAHVFTGWTFASDDPDYYYLWGEPNYAAPMEYWPEHHDLGPKRLLDGEVAPAGRAGPVEMAHVLDRLFHHPNTGPFICRQLIQRLVTSNPSPGYVYRVARVFADNGQGTRGDLRAVVRAILLDPEARSPAVAAQPGFGKLREPLIRIANLWRACQASASGGLYNFAWTQSWFGQEVLQSPTVFNFFRPGYVTPGPAAAAGLVAPEFQIATDGNLAELFNTLDWFTQRPAEWTEDPVLNLDAEIALLGDPDALCDRMSLLLFGGGMSSATRAQIKTMLAALPSWYSARDRAVAAVFLAVSAPDHSIQK